MTRGLGALGLVLLLAGLCACSSAYQGPPSDHFDGQRFFNPGHRKDSSVGGYLWLRLTESQAAWPEAVPVAPQPAPPPRVGEGRARITFVGHATLLLQLAGKNVITDPVWSERASPFRWTGPKRVSPPGVAFDALPRIDLVLISHDHYDHLDLATLARLDARDRPRVLVPLGTRRLVAEAMPNSEVSEHDWGDRIELAPLRLSFEPLLHGSGRSPFDQQQRLWAAFVIEGDGWKLFHAGDTGYGPAAPFAATGAKHGGFDLALLPIGAYEPVSFMKDSHMTPAEAVQVMRDLRARRALAHHFGSFQLGFESREAPLLALAAARRAAGLAEQDFPALQPGEHLELRRD
jgi:L-ascorbate metabolism protein UlaG (beta-lactamase superfamily)